MHARLEDVPTVEPGEGQVRLKVAYVGICGSDLHYYYNGANGAYVITGVDDRGTRFLPNGTPRQIDFAIDLLRIDVDPR